MICPHRLLDGRQIFFDAMHLLTAHEPGNRLCLIPEFTVPGGSIDYILASVRDDRVVDFVGIELQTLDTTGTVWPARERFIESIGLPADKDATSSNSPFGLNWKMTAKTILMQLHHKLGTFEHVNRRLVLVLQTPLLEYMRREFRFGHLASPPSVSDSLQFHAYTLYEADYQRIHMRLGDRASTDNAGMAQALGLQADTNVELVKILEDLTRKLSASATLTLPVQANL